MGYQFLSPEYFEAATRLLAADPDVRSAIDGVEVSLLYAVRGGPDGNFAYHIDISGGEVEVARGELDNPSATVKSTYDTAGKIARRELSNQVAFLTGRVKLSGNLGALMKHNSTLDLIQEKLSGLDTIY
ncbi:MAG: SCP2 sterol-binding domain-containing protein [Acidimicrobiia bacterium]